MTLQSSGQITLGDIANEFGYTNGSSTRLGSYRTTNGQGNFPLSLGSLSYSSIDGGGAVPTSGQIKLSDFRGTQLQTVVNFYGSGKGGTRLNAYSRYNAGDVTVVGGYRTRPSNTSGTRVKIHVNQSIGSEKNSINHCALRTGNGWNSGTTLSVDVGSNGRIQGAGGNGGAGSINNGSGSPGGNGSSGLGVEYTETAVNIASGGVIAAGFGGGGGGAGGEQTDKPGTRYAAGGGGGGGAGLPVGEGGAGGITNAARGSGPGQPGSDASLSGGTQGSGTAGDGGSGGNNANEAGGSPGGEGGQAGNSADQGGNNDGTGGAGGSDGSAIRRTNGSIVVDINDGGRVVPNAVANGVA